MAYRKERIEKIIERELANICLFESNNPLLSYVTITKVALNDDLSVATVWYSVTGTDEEKEATKKALIQSKGFLRSKIAKCLDIHHTPDLRFTYDNSIEYGNHIEEILKEINNK